MVDLFSSFKQYRRPGSPELEASIVGREREHFKKRQSDDQKFYRLHLHIKEGSLYWYSNVPENQTSLNL